MTFSIVAYDLNEHAWGVAVASKFPAVGAVVPWAQANAGAVATQSFANTSFGARGLELMAAGTSAEQALAKLLIDDPERDLRQVGLVDSRGAAATFTGKGCYSWAGGVKGEGYAIQGNILSGSRVVTAMQRKFLSTKGNLPRRLHAALLAGDRAGGDRRGRQSAAIYIVKPYGGYGGFTDRWIDYRIDDHQDPVQQLGKLLDLHELYFGKSPQTDRVHMKGRAFERFCSLLKENGYMKSHADFKSAFSALIGNENFEERADPDAGWIDRPAYKHLLKKFGK